MEAAYAVRQSRSATARLQGWRHVAVTTLSTYFLLARCLHSHTEILHSYAGLELMDTMGSLQEAAYERLCR